MRVKSLRDLNSFKSSPKLDKDQIDILSNELKLKIKKCDWLTIGIMAPNDLKAKEALSSFIMKYKINDFKDFANSKANGNVFLKGNQKTGEVYIRSENGLGEGILLTCQYDDKSKNSSTYGPFPLNFFEK